MDYSNLGLNDQLRAINSPAGGTVNSVDSLAFDTDYEVPSNGLSYDKIRSITADQISAGTINSTVVYAGNISADKITSGTLGNFQIIINDGTTDRILIGYGSGLF